MLQEIMLRISGFLLRDVVVRNFCSSTRRSSASICLSLSCAGSWGFGVCVCILTMCLHVEYPPPMPSKTP
jgi:hypothetical protein